MTPLYEFGSFCLDVADARLTCHGNPLEASPRALAVLHCLLQGAGRLVRKHDLLGAVWGRQAVSDAAVRTVINEIRAVLGDDARRPTYIETVPRQGYRFIMPVAGRPTLAAAGTLPARTAQDEAMPTANECMRSVGTGTGEALRPVNIAELPASAGQVLVGREDELAALSAMHRRAALRTQGLVLVLGEPGIGKSLLLRRFLQQRLAEHASVAMAQCIEQVVAGPPCMTVLDALRQWCQGQHGPAWIQALPAVAPGWWAQLSPQRPVPDSDLHSSTPRTQGTAVSRLPLEFSALLDALPEGLTPVLLIDDLHWSDSATLDLLRWLLLRERLPRLLVAASYSPAEARDPAHALHALRHALRQKGRCTELALRRFSQSDVAAVAAAHGMVPDGGLAAALHVYSGGLPLCVAGTVRALCGDAHPAAPSTPSDWTQLPLPDTVAGMIDRQMLSLPPTHVTLLEIAAVEGLEISAPELSTASGLDPAEVSAALGELARGERWLRISRLHRRPRGPFEWGYAFPHESLRQAFLGRQSQAQRLQAHLAWAQAWRRTAGHGLQRRRKGFLPIAERIAHHFDKALELGSSLDVDMGDISRHALGWRLRAARAAVAALAFEEALGHYGRALHHAPSLGHRVRIHAERSELMCKRGVVDDALQESRLALELASAQDNPALLRLARLCRARVAVRCGMPSEAISLTDQLLTPASEAVQRHPDDRTALLTVRATALATLVKTDDAEATWRLAMHQAPRDDHLARGRILTSALVTDFIRADFAAGADRARQALTHFRRTGDDYSMVASSINLGAVEVQLGALDEARNTLEAAARQARGLRNVILERAALINLIDVEAEAADTLRVADLLSQAQRLEPLEDSPEMASALRQARFRAHLMAGDLGAAWREASAWQADTRPQGESHGVLSLAHALPGLLSLLGGHVAATALLARAGSLCGPHEMVMHRMRLEMRSALLDLEAANPRAALARLQAAEPIETSVSDGVERRLLQARALLALKQPEDALAVLPHSAKAMPGRLAVDVLSLRIRAGALAGVSGQAELTLAEPVLADAALPMLARLGLLQAVCLAQARDCERPAPAPRHEQLDAVTRALLQSLRTLPTCQRALLRRLPASMTWKPLPVF